MRRFADLLFCLHDAPSQLSQIGRYVSPVIRPTALHAHINESGIRWSLFRFKKFHYSSYGPIVEIIAPASI